MTLLADADQTPPKPRGKPGLAVIPPTGGSILEPGTMVAGGANVQF
jgi:hypothetical protein